MQPNGAQHAKTTAHILCISRALSPRGQATSNDKPSLASTLFESAKSNLHSLNTSNHHSPDLKLRTKTESTHPFRRHGIKLVERAGTKESLIANRNRLESVGSELRATERELIEMQTIKKDNWLLRLENSNIRESLSKNHWEDRNEETTRQRMHEAKMRRL